MTKLLNVKVLMVVQILCVAWSLSELAGLNFNVFLIGSPQDDSIQSAVAPSCPQASIPLLMACTANVKTVVANPIVYLTNLTHDILQTINALDSPPHPDVVNNEVKTTAKTAGSDSHLAGSC